jgi:multiple sugar transport system substrate-binding protein
MSKKNNRSKKMLAVFVSLVLLLTVLTGCIGSPEEVTDDKKRVLRIATVYGDRNYTDHLRSQYTDLFAFSNRNIEIEFVTAIDYGSQRYGKHDPEEEQPDPIEEMKKLMQGPNPPDVILMGINELPGLVDENLLTPLEPLMSQDEIDVNDFVPSVIDGLKALGNDQLYALSPTFSSQALMYNAGIFNELGVDLPTDNMYWEDVFNLARQLTTGEGEDKKYGFSFSPHYYSDLYYDMRSYVAPLELQMFDEGGEHMLVDSQSWVDAWQTMVTLSEDDILPEQPDYSEPMYRESDVYNPFQHDAFLSGKVAMTIVDYGRINEIINANTDADLIEGYTYIDWDVVTMPVHPQAPDVGGYVHMDPIMGINAKAENSEDAWAFIKFMNSKEWAELKSQSTSNMVSRKEFIKPRGGAQFNIEAFYTLRPAPMGNDMRMGMPSKNNEAMWRIESMGQQKFFQVLQGELTVSEALKQWQTEGDALLLQVKENPDAPIFEEPGTMFDGMTKEEAELKMKVMEAAGETVEEPAVEAEVEVDVDVGVDSDSSSSSSSSSSEVSSE